MVVGKKNMEVDTNLLQVDFDYLADCVSQLKLSLSELKDSVKELSTTWEGESKVACMLQLRSDCQRLDRVHLYLEEYLNCMIYAITEYDSCEDAVCHMIRNMDI